MMKYYIRFNPSKEFVQMLYRLVIDTNILQYRGEQGNWHFSFSYNAKKEEFFVSPWTKEITEAEMQKYIANGQDK